jgi:hypothetical protein
MRHLADGSIKIFHLDQVKPFFGDPAEGRKVALADSDQYVIDVILAYRGDPTVRTTIELEVKFASGVVKWLPWTQALYDTIQYEDFCRSQPHLFPLLYLQKEATARITSLNRSPIDAVQLGNKFFLNLRYFGEAWYSSQDFPDSAHVSYFFEAVYEKWTSSKHYKIWAHVPVLKTRFELNHFLVFCFGTLRELPPNGVVVTPAFMKAHPCLKDLAN